MNQHLYTIVIITCVILFSIFRRVRRNFGWQPLNSRTIQLRMVLYFVIGLLFFIVGGFNPVSLISDVAGILIGAILAYCGAGMTHFEQRGDRVVYRPNTWIGSLVTVIFFGRLFYRFYEMYMYNNLGGLPKMGYYDIRNPWSAGLMLIMFAYYVVYYCILIRNRKQLSHSGKIMEK